MFISKVLYFHFSFLYQKKNETIPITCNVFLTSIVFIFTSELSTEYNGFPRMLSKFVSNGSWLHKFFSKVRISLIEEENQNLCNISIINSEPVL